MTFWLFTPTTLKIAPTMRDELQISGSLRNTALSITALFSGIFVVVAASLADRFGRVKLTNVALALSGVGLLPIAISPMVGRDQTASAHCLRWCAMKPTLPRLHEIVQHPEPHNAS